MLQELKSLGIIAAIIGAFFLLILFLSKPSEPNLTQDIVKNNLILENSTKTGKLDSRVSLVEFADMQCPGCAGINPTLVKLHEEYKDKVLFVFRHFPLPQHKNALAASLAAEAAGEQGKFWEMQEVIYAQQSDWENQSSPNSFFVDYAKRLKLDVDKFTKALGKNELKAKINQDIASGNALQVNSTPTFFLNGQKYTAAFSYQELKSTLDKLLQ